MNKVFSFALLSTCALTTSSLASAKNITIAEKPVTVEIRYGRATVFRFDSKVSSVQNAEKFEIAPLNDQSPNYAEISLKPRTTTQSDVVTFHLADGNMAHLKLVPALGPKADRLETFHSVKMKEASTVNFNQKEQMPFSEDMDEGDGKAELMKSLILGGRLRGYQIKNIDKPLKTGLAGVDAVLVRTYTSKDLNGYVFRISNIASKSKYEIDVRRLKLGEPNLALMSQVDRKVIEPAGDGKDVAYLTIVALPSSRSRDVVLPVSWVNKEAK